MADFTMDRFSLKGKTALVTGAVLSVDGGYTCL